MVLSYIYIHTEFRNIIDQEFNFDPEFIFFLENGKLAFKPNPDFIPKFFPVEINNVTAIIGQNGAGKSSLLKYIQSYFADELKNDFREFDIIIFRNNNQLTIIYDLNGKNEELYYDLQSKFKIKPNGFKNYAGISKNTEIKKELATIFYSNNFDSINEIENFPTLINISTNYFTQKGNSLLRLRKTKVDNNLSFKNYEANEAKRQILFIRSRKKAKKKIDIELNIPETISFVLDKFSQSGLLYTRKIKNLNPISKEQHDSLKNLCIEIQSKVLNTNILDKFQKNLSIGFYNSFLNSLFDIESYFYFENSIKKLNKLQRKEYSEFIFPIAFAILNYVKKLSANISNYKTFFETLKESRNHVETVHKKSSIIHKGLHNKFKSYFNLGELIIQMIDANFNVVNHFEGRVDVNYSSLNEIITVAFSPQNSINKFFDFKFRGMSSGQNSLLKMFSRFHEIFELSTEKNKPTILILLDEADLHFHPEWQQKFLTILFEFINEYKKEGILENVQIICTSHSPFLASDLPQGKIIYMKNENGHGVVSPDEDHVQTFGTNIHTLFLDSFFMNNSNGTLGDFAAKKIDEIIDKVYEAKEKGTKLDEIWLKKIEIIGEEVVKLKLLDILNQNEKNR